MFKVFINSYYGHIHMRYIPHDCNFKNINQLIFFVDFLWCCEKVHDSKKFSCGNSNLHCESRIMSH